MPRRGAGMIALICLVFLLAFGLWSSTRGGPARDGPRSLDPPRPHPISLGQAERDDRVGREPANLEELKEAVERTSRALEGPSWHEAEAGAQEIFNRWLSFKPAMRAQAGTRMWSTTDTDAFSTRLDDLQAHIAERRKDAARNDVQALYRIVNRYDPTPDRHIEE